MIDAFIFGVGFTFGVVTTLSVYVALFACFLAWLGWYKKLDVIENLRDMALCPSCNRQQRTKGGFIVDHEDRNERSYTKKCAGSGLAAN